jgi:hypothetical protein
MTPERGDDAFRGVDHGRGYGDVAFELQEAIAVRRAITVEGLEATVGRGTADPGRTLSAHDGLVDRLALVPGLSPRCRP